MLYKREHSAPCTHAKHIGLIYDKMQQMKKKRCRKKHLVLKIVEIKEDNPDKDVSLQIRSDFDRTF